MKSRKLLLPMISALSLAVSLSVSAAYPLTVHNCDRDESFQAAPQRVVTIGQHETELLLALGLEKKIAGTSVWFGPLPDGVRAAGKDLKRLADNAPGFEAVVAQKPDLVLAQYSWHLGPQGEVASRERFEQLGINTWLSPADCIGKAVTAESNGDGARSAPFSLDAIYQEISQLAQIFDVEPRGLALTEQLAGRITRVQQQLKAAQVRPLKVLYWFSSTRLNGDPWVAGRDGAPGWISRTLGLQNVIASNQEWPAVSWEQIARLQPDVIVLASMDRRLYPADDITQKMAFLHSDPVTRELPAVKNNQLIVVPAMSLNPSLRNVDAVELIGQQIARSAAQP